MIKKKNIPIIFLLFTCVLGYGGQFFVSNIEFTGYGKAGHCVQEIEVLDYSVNSEDVLVLSLGMTEKVESKAQFITDNYDPNNRELKDYEVLSILKSGDNLLFDG